MIALGLKGTGDVLAARDPEAAARLLGASDRLFAELGAHVEAGEQATYDETVAELRRELGDEPYRGAHAEGRAAPLDQMLDLALRAASPS
jgi:hypothetical protein